MTSRVSEPQKGYCQVILAHQWKPHVTHLKVGPYFIIDSNSWCCPCSGLSFKFIKEPLVRWWPIVESVRWQICSGMNVIDKWAIETLEHAQNFCHVECMKTIVHFANVHWKPRVVMMPTLPSLAASRQPLMPPMTTKLSSSRFICRCRHAINTWK